MITQIDLKNFKNHTHSHLDFQENLSILIGKNGAGKTNLLESIFVLCNGCTRGSEGWGSLHATNTPIMFAQMTTQENAHHISLDHEKKSPQFYVNGDKKTRPKYLQSIKKTAFLLDSLSLNILYLGPSLRRDFLDQTIGSSHPEYRKILNEYKKILTQRNALLKRISDGIEDAASLPYWDNLFIQHASQVYHLRFEFMDFVQTCTHKISDLLEKKYPLSFHSHSKVHPESIQSDLKIYLQGNQQKEILLKRTCIGPHLDDFSFQIFEKNSTEYLSRGENKMLLLGIILLATTYSQKKSQKEGILLLDDIFSELDEDHIKKLLEATKNFQTIITTQPNHLPKISTKKHLINI